MNFESIKNDLIDEVKLTPIQTNVFLLIVTEGKMTTEQISQKLKISEPQAVRTAKELIKLGGFIELSENEFETMHPRFTAVNMYRRRCEQDNVEFKKNFKVDNIGALLEDTYDDARTK